MRTQRDFFVDSVSSTQVQLVRSPVVPTPSPESDPGVAMHRIVIFTGHTLAANADTSFWVANCTRYRVTVERIS